MQTASLLENVSAYFDQAAALTTHPKGLLDQIKSCNSIYCVQFPFSPGNRTFVSLTRKTPLRRYGLTETSGAATVTRFEDNKVGSVGTPLNEFRTD